MLGKLLKYDLKYMIKNMSIFYILAIFFALATRVLFSLKQTVIISIISQISVGCMFALIINILFNTVIRSWVRFRDSLYKDEAYLTHTLPVTKMQIYESRFLEALVFMVIGFVFMVVSLFITYYTPNNWTLLKDTVNSLSLGINLNTSFIVISIILIFFLEVFNIMQCGFLALIIGHKKNNRKIAYSFLFGFIIYMLSQMVVLLCTFITGIFNSNVMSIFNSSSLIDTSVIKLLVILAILVYTSIIFIMNIICVKLLNKGVDID